MMKFYDLNKLTRNIARFSQLCRDASISINDVETLSKTHIVNICWRIPWHDPRCVISHNGLKALAQAWWLRIGRARGGSSSVVLANERGGGFSSRISAVLAFDCRHRRHVWEMCSTALEEWEMGWARDADGMRRPRIDGCLSPSTIEGGR